MIAARSFRDVHGDIGATHEFIADTVLWRDGDSDRSAERESHRVDVDGRAAGHRNLLRRTDGVLTRIDLHDDSELVASEAGDRRVGGSGVAQPVRDLRKHEISVVMSQDVVQLFEAIEIDGHYGVVF